ncbi:MAG: cardiolipin synthase, partial [Humisphaera sp.]|nr:cardiolipin synthase [Humisphaera sp.]
MTLQSANDIIRARALGSPDSDTGVTRPRDPNCAVEQGDLGTSGGVNIAPGSDDDGWTVPQPVELSDGTRLQLYKDGEALHAAYDAIKNAKKRICLEVYIFADDDTGRAFADLLCEKAQQGVKVYVIYDSFGSHSVPHLWKRTAEIFKKMRR